MTQFNWQTEEDIVWEELPAPDPPPPPPNRRRRLIMIGVVVLLFMVVSAVVYWQVNRRVEIAMQDVRDEVLASHNLVQRAAAEQDTDLLTSLMSGRNMNWVGEITTLVAEDSYFDRSPFALEKRPFIPEAAVAETSVAERNLPEAQITLSPDLTRAEVTVLQPYSYQGDGEEIETVYLTQTAVYRLGTERWLYSPPTTDFWGDWQTIENDQLTIRFRTRDEEIVTRLEADLTDRFSEACRLIRDLVCDSGFFVQLQFDSDPGTLDLARNKWEPIADMENGWELALPAPTLVGLPIDEQGYDILFRGYARELITAVMLHQADWVCCRGELFATALVEYELARLELGAWPVTAADYEQVIAENIVLNDLSSFYIINDLRSFSQPLPWQEVYTAVDFLIQLNGQQTPLEMIAKLKEDLSLSTWLGSVLSMEDIPASGADQIANAASLAWRLHAQAQVLAAVSDGRDPPIALPNQTLYQTCLGVNEVQEVADSAVYELVDPSGDWELAFAEETLLLTVPFVDDSGLIVQHLNFASNQSNRAELWQNGRSVPLHKETEEVWLTFGQTDPTGRQLFRFHFDNGDGSATLWSVDLASCEDGNCQERHLPGTPSWSPNGQLGLFATQEAFGFFNLDVGDRALIFDISNQLQQQDAPILLGQADGRPFEGEETLREVGVGFAPVWFDDQSFGYFRLIDESSPFSPREFVYATIEDPQPRRLLGTPELRATLPDADIADRIRFGKVLRHPTDENHMFVVGFDASEALVYVWSFNHVTGALALELSLGYSFWHSLGVSPNGRFLLLQGSENTSGPLFNLGKMLIKDLETGVVDTYEVGSSFYVPSFSYDWSRDSEWLAFSMSSNRAVLKALAHDYAVVIPTGGTNCPSVSWLD